MGLVRVFLALSVAACHNAFVLGGFLSGMFAVKLFFAISGFCMALVLNRKYTERNPTRFYIARYLRLWPTYIVVLMLIVVFIQPLPSDQSIPFYAAAFSLFGSEALWWVDPIGRYAGLVGLEQMWSVGIELSFYLVSPLFARSWRATLILFLVAFAAHAWFVMTGGSLKVPFERSQITFFWIYLLGMLAYWAWTILHPYLDRLKIPALAAALVGVAMAGGFAILRGCWPMGYFGNFREDVLIAAFIAYMILLFHITRSNKFDRMIGELSYPIYVVHWPLTHFLITGHRGSALWTVIILALAVAAAVALHVLIERPIDRWRSKPLATPLPSGAKAALIQ